MSTLPELRELERILELGKDRLEAHIECEVSAGNKCFPVYRLTLGNPDPKLPAIGFFGGVHGLERIGTQVLLYFLRSLLTRLEWDSSMHHLLQDVRLVFMPLINPGGMWQSTRSTPRGVDLMRNAPVEATGGVPFLLGGHRISPHLPWYRGAAGAEMESENLALCRTVQEELLPRPFSIAVDCHSGFGARDRIWFPHAHSVHPIDHLADILRLEELFQQTHPNTRYLFEPQSVQYRTHGDIWDYLYLQSQNDRNRTFLPLTLEMGSWLWVKKNPLQLFSRHGIFNPSVEHRLHRVLRRHAVWLDFLMRAAGGYDNWLVKGPTRLRMQERAVMRWYRR
ncbi:M14 family zinc carboxypeptidase [Sideroxydans lithotrophicus]|uniref:Peptidase M14 carboxypeptidase A n=1 Tax=Sideroxydans lithotrophicus (strain ES-1) TaxID=580332 RepID=D5CR19_SIDLE|nr:M14 family zinc carboxypeptidase [Sideroxydans lithotrophicus]ADE11405.1 peptidase M14 carboxypeptidase A [Sideroxydans lithotrophicus ES-1]